MVRQSPRANRRRPPASSASAAGLAAIALSSVIAAVDAAPSDPIRNINPEERAGPDDVQNPIYFVMPVGTVGDRTGVAPEAILQEFLNKHTAMDYPGAVEAAMRLTSATPDRSIGYYNLACALARQQRADESLEALRKSIELGWRDAVHTAIDPDLAPLRSDDRYAVIIADLRARIERERIAPVPLRIDAWEAVAADLARETPLLLQRYHVPGATVALVRDGEVVWTAAFGVRDARVDEPMGVEDRFRLRAPLHLLAIAACEQLEAQQKLQLAPLIVEAVNECGLTQASAASDGQAVASGVQPAGRRDSGSRSAGSGQERVASIRNPMRSYARHSVYGFLRLAIEEVAEESFPRYCEQSIFPDLNLSRSAFGAPAEPLREAVGHSALGTPLRPSVMHGEFAPGGCLYTTAGDVARMIAATMPPDPPADQVDPEPLAIGDVFMPEAGDARLARAIEMVTQADQAMEGTFGLALQRRDGGEGAVRYLMDESASGIVLLARWHPQTRDGVVVLCNAATGRDAAERIAHLALGGER